MSLLGAKIRALRLEHGVTQTALANALGITQAHLSAIERSVRPRDVASLDVVIAFALFFEVTTDYLLRDDESVGSAPSSAVNSKITKQPQTSQLGAKLRDLRNQQGLSLTGAVDTIEKVYGRNVLSRSHLGNLETGKKQPSLDSIVALADFYKVTTDYLLRDEPNTK